MVFSPEVSVWKLEGVPEQVEMGRYNEHSDTD